MRQEKQSLSDFSVLDIKDILYFVLSFQTVTQIQPPSSLIGFWENLNAECSADEVLNSMVIEQEGRDLPPLSSTLLQCFLSFHNNTK